MDTRNLKESERKTSMQHTSVPQSEGVQTQRRKRYMQDSGVLLSLCGVLACNYLGFGLGRVVCQGLLLATLGAPARRAGAR